VEFLGLSIQEMVVIVIVAILVFGPRLPQVAGEAAATLQRVKRSLADLRRETGIDQEIARARREFETSVRRPLAVELPETIRRETRVVKDAIERAVETPPAPAKAPEPLDSGASSAPAAPTAPEASAPERSATPPPPERSEGGGEAGPTRPPPGS
jgi:Sec-independent protein translocase protein TatA